MVKSNDGCLVLGLALAVLPIVMIVRGLVLKTLWLWFVVPFGAPQLNMAWAMGLALLAHTATYTDVSELARKPSIERAEPIERLISAVVTSIGTPLIVLLMGWLLHSFM